jgi:hypothetical protein
METASYLIRVSFRLISKSSTCGRQLFRESKSVLFLVAHVPSLKEANSLVHMRIINLSYFGILFKRHAVIAMKEVPETTLLRYQYNPSHVAACYAPPFL